MRKNKNILIIDDEKDFCYFVKKNLELFAGYNVVTATSGTKGIRAAWKEKPDIILLDIMMPGIEGFEVLEKLKKNKKTCVEKGNINEWTFGIVTNGSRPDSVLKLINSIRAQNIGRYEVIICGSYKGKLAKDMRLIDFSFRDDLGWITRKKNKIILESKYENLIIMHDRLFLKDDWFEQVRKWGNSFEVLAMPQIYFSTGQRLASWQHYEFSANSVYKWNIPLAHMDYLDWGKYMLDCGAITAGKKTILKKILFNETLYWGDFEDCVLSNRLVDSGYIFRLVPNAIVYSGTNSLVSVVNRRHLYDKNRLGKIITKPFHIYVAYKILDSLRVYRDNKLILPIFNRVMTYLKNKGNIITHRDL